MRLMKSALFIFLLIAAIAAVTLAPIPSHAQDGGELTEFVAGDVRFVYPADFATSITETAVEAVPFEKDGSPIYGSNPAHMEFVFEDYPVIAETRQIAMISIYPTADFEAFTVRDDDPFGYGVELETLAALLDERPDLTLYTDPTLITTPESLTLPFLPPQYAGQVFRTQAEYIPFDDGWGVRYITYFTQGLAEVREQDLLYTFQGISTDGSTYIAVQFPISSGLLATEYDPDADLDDYAGYMQGVAAMLGEHDPELFDPTLPALDSLILSLSINGTIDYVPTPEPFALEIVGLTVGSYGDVMNAEGLPQGCLAYFTVQVRGVEAVEAEVYADNDAFADPGNLERTVTLVQGDNMLAVTLGGDQNYRDHTIHIITALGIASVSARCQD